MCGCKDSIRFRHVEEYSASWNNADVMGTYIEYDAFSAGCAQRSRMLRQVRAVTRRDIILSPELCSSFLEDESEEDEEMGWPAGVEQPPRKWTFTGWES